jgi:hypothetical protein
VNTPAVSIVVEWENVLLAGAPRAALAVRRLADEAGSVAGPVEILLCGTEADAPVVPDIAARDGVEWRACAAPGVHYYELKNHGVLASRGELVVFLDSDAVPEPGWLSALLAPFADPDVAVVAGHTYLACDSVYTRAFALTWFFPLREAPGRFDRAAHFFANNLAMRRQTALAYPFEPSARESRGACLALADRLARDGVTIRQTTSAQVSHPAPVAGWHFVWRAVAQGRDRQARERGWRAWPLASLLRWVRHSARGLLRIIRYGATVGLSPVWMPAAVLVCWTYYTIYLAGELGGLCRIPAVMRVRV